MKLKETEQVRSSLSCSRFSTWVQTYKQLWGFKFGLSVREQSNHLVCNCRYYKRFPLTQDYAEKPQYLFGGTSGNRLPQMKTTASCDFGNSKQCFHLITKAPFLHNCSLKARQVLQLCRHGSHMVHSITPVCVHVLDTWLQITQTLQCGPFSKHAVQFYKPKCIFLLFPADITFHLFFAHYKSQLADSSNLLELCN